MTQPFKFVLSPFLFLSFFAEAQSYPPPVGQSGTTAMHKDSSAFVAWATGCESVRGLENISLPAGPYASVGDNSMALGKAQTNAVLCLGDGGSAVCTFASPLKNDPGPDFAVFENSFDDLFLELAFVEVSSDGVNFVRFRSHSLTDPSVQTSSFGSTDATKINNLAGKYRGGYGTPFDLQELSGAVNLNVNAITHIKIIDVVGSVNSSYATLDSYGNKVNDPWPTAFSSGGFDLDAIGVIHQNAVTGLDELSVSGSMSVFPNPADANTTVRVTNANEIQTLDLLDLSGRVLLHSITPEINLSGIDSGVYLFRITTDKGVSVKKLIVRS